MNKKLIKIFSILVMVIMLSSIALNVFALSPSDITADSTVKGATEITNVGKKVVGILQAVGVILSVIVLIVLGIKYMMGSAEEKAEYKKTMIPYLVGAILIFAASTIANVVYKFATGLK